jgi:hypothetical protein
MLFGVFLFSIRGPPAYAQLLFGCVRMLVSSLQLLNDLLAGGVLHSRSACVPVPLRLLIFHLVTAASIRILRVTEYC